MKQQKKIIRHTAQVIPTFSDTMPMPLKRVLAHRGLTDLKEVTYALEHLLPFKDLLNIDKAVEVLVEALTKQARLLIVGDFDADGATSTALAVSALKAFGAKNVSYLVPNRFENGYGLTPEIVDIAAKQQPDLIITVDNGISSVEGVERAKFHGISVLITDHHLPGAQVPQALAIVNPNQHNDLFKSKNLAGVGVVFYLMWALRNRLHEQEWFATNHQKPPNLASFLDLVALGTVADLVPLDYNNRILVQQGLQRIRSVCRPGIQALLEVARRNPATLVAADLGFALGPRLNAAGRLQDMSLGIECLLSETLQKAREIAQNLDRLNQERRIIEGDMQRQADQILADFSLNYPDKSTMGLCLYHEDWHQGVIGILASRVKDQIYRPVIAFAKGIEAGVLKGSGRSVPGLHIRDVLDIIASRYPTLIAKFGGHAQAAGLQIASEHFVQFSVAFDQVVTERLSADNLTDRLMSDGELTGEEFSVQLAYLFRETTPWGQQFPQPLFDGVFKVLEQRLISNKHLKLSLLADSCSRPLSAIAFNVDVDIWPNEAYAFIQAAYRLDINTYQGQQNLQLIVEHLEPAIPAERGNGFLD